MFDPHRFFPTALLDAPLPTKREYGRLVNLSNNELRHPLLDGIIARFYATSEATWVNCYPYWPSVLASVARHFGLSADEVSLSAGSDQAIRAIVRLAAVAGHRLVVQWPNYRTYSNAAASEGVVAERVPSVDCSPEEEIAALCATVRRSGQALVVLTNPHAITGRLLSSDAVACLAAVCEDAGDVLLIDEAYVWFSGRDHVDLLRQFPNLVLLRSFSKGFGMAGLRFSALLASAGIQEYFARAWCVAEVSSFAGAFVEHCLAEERVLVEIWKDIALRRDRTAVAVAALNEGWFCPPSRANFQLVTTGSPESTRRIVSGLESRGIVVRSLAHEPTVATSFRYTVCGDDSTEHMVEALKEFAMESNPRPALRAWG